MVVQCNNGAAIPYIGVIQDRICIILDYNGNSILHSTCTNML